MFVIVYDYHDYIMRRFSGVQLGNDFQPFFLILGFPTEK